MFALLYMLQRTGRGAIGRWYLGWRQLNEIEIAIAQLDQAKLRARKEPLYDSGFLLEDAVKTFRRNQLPCRCDAAAYSTTADKRDTRDHYVLTEVAGSDSQFVLQIQWFTRWIQLHSAETQVACLPSRHARHIEVCLYAWRRDA
jgi:hypothetical protein